MRKGIYTPGDIVHHKVEHVTPLTVDNPEVTLAFDNLELLCRQCHAEEHGEMYGHDNRRYTVDECGRVAMK